MVKGLLKRLRRSRSHPKKKVARVQIEKTTVVRTTYTFLTGTREHKRVNIAVPIKITTQDHSIPPTMVCTYEVSLNGCKIANSMGLQKVDQLVWINRMNRRAMYKVVWIGAAGGARNNQVGLRLADGQKIIWDTDLAKRLSK